MVHADTKPPLILTLGLAPDAQAFFAALRRLHFPAERNVVPAHLTLFHHLPWNDTVLDTLREVATEQPGFQLEVTGPRSLGRGVCYGLSSATLVALRGRLSQAFAADLIPQDRQGFRPHIVIQNKVSAEEARTLLAQQLRSPAPSQVEACGLDLWQYLGGPWEHLQTFAFAER
jgi:2'-5' RNA ligase